MKHLPDFPPIARPVQVIRLPSGRRVTMGQYLAAWRKLKATPPNLKLRDWDHYPTAASEIMAEIRRGVHDRINRRGAEVPESRVHPAVWGMAQTPRAIIEGCDLRTMPPAARKALAHRAR